MSSFQLNLSSLKEPLGFIKVLEKIAYIFAFATCGGFEGKTEILARFLTIKILTIKQSCFFGDPVMLDQASFQALPSVNAYGVEWKKHVLISDYSSSAQSCVNICSLYLLADVGRPCYRIAALLLCVGYVNLYWGNQKPPMIDFVVTLVAIFLWLVSTSAWAKALTDIKIAVGCNIVQELAPCNSQEVMCYFGSVTSMGSLYVSVIFGFLNMLLWGGNAWFVYKENSLHSPSNTASHNQRGIPPPTRT
ncbi:LOW QUALITY PROTEIN: synaptophysin-like protein 1 [Pteronotus mesoamericanus]|uniref:LOW QUALITY PROTEIN: synaptophysin-like protein 1 n=1 Tax=Pteronotus mesoamericanus TaxID=1884717 RepID=UPI0023EB3610|nr:LOW QUALITY PROTEIN: synaptophysin-like protein 1 [Pteronotus parnellii mesoamericanus]